MVKFFTEDNGLTRKIKVVNGEKVNSYVANIVKRFVLRKIALREIPLEVNTDKVRLENSPRNIPGNSLSLDISRISPGEVLVQVTSLEGVNLVFIKTRKNLDEVFYELKHSRCFSDFNLRVTRHMCDRDIPVVTTNNKEKAQWFAFA